MTQMSNKPMMEALFASSEFQFAPPDVRCCCIKLLELVVNPEADKASPACSAEPIKPKKSVRFVPEPIVEYFSENRASKKCFNFQMPPVQGEVSEIAAKINRWSDSPQDCELYETNMQINTISSEINDFSARRENTKSLTSKTVIKELKLKNWHTRGPKPLRNLLGLILLSPNVEVMLKDISTPLIQKITSINNRIVEDLERKKRNMFVLYEVDAKIYLQNCPMLKRKGEIMEKVIQERVKSGSDHSP